MRSRSGGRQVRQSAAVGRLISRQDRTLNRKRGIVVRDRATTAGATSPADRQVADINRMPAEIQCRSNIEDAVKSSAVDDRLIRARANNLDGSIDVEIAGRAEVFIRPRDG